MTLSWRENFVSSLAWFEANKQINNATVWLRALFTSISCVVVVRRQKKFFSFSCCWLINGFPFVVPISTTNEMRLHDLWASDSNFVFFLLFTFRYELLTVGNQKQSKSLGDLLEMVSELNRRSGLSPDLSGFVSVMMINAVIKQNYPLWMVTTSHQESCPTGENFHVRCENLGRWFSPEFRVITLRALMLFIKGKRLLLYCNCHRAAKWSFNWMAPNWNEALAASLNSIRTQLKAFWCRRYETTWFCGKIKTWWWPES